MDAEDDRQHARSPAKLEASLASELGQIVRGAVRDVSVAGLFVITKERLPVGTLCELAVEAIDDEGIRRVEAAARVAHVAPEGMGLEITDLAVGDYDELRRWVDNEEPDEA